jgi:DMSO/TMAO reductase YedYZ molybdopterin-dependent catalytic subunit
MEKIKQYRVWILTLLVVLLLLMTFWISIYFQSQPKELYPQQIRNYQGQNLSSITNVYENNIAGTQFINTSTYKLTVTGLVNRTVQYSYDDVLNSFQKYRKVVTLHCVEGWSATILWEGFLVNDLLQQAGVKPNAVSAIFYAADNFSTALPLDYLTSKNIIMAYKMNNLTIPPERGFPFQLVAESQYGYKWIKWLTTIELTDNPNYLGYWESRGFANNATIP